MHKLEILKKIDSTRLSNFLRFVKYSKFNLFPNVNNGNIHKYLFDLITDRLQDSIVFSYSVNAEIISLVIVRILEWDSNHFGFRCASIDEVFYNYTSDNELLLQALNKTFGEIENEAICNHIEFISVSVNSIDSIVSSALQANHFKYILTWINGIYNSKEKIKLNTNCFEIGLAKGKEIEYYKDLASKHYFKGGRFYLDNNYDVSLVNSMYSDLIISSYDNKDIMLSYRSKGKSLGLFICKKIVKYDHFNNMLVAPLRYLIVDPETRQKHIGYELFAGTINYLLERCDIITTGLEVHNFPSLNLHIKLNFRFNYTHNVFHWWSPKR